ncbi:Inorganic phosphate transporter [Wickerhamomyces ciferrii]|uniref:Inorganic phosphate transporter n=1 Tax=Wickerhamomyces ciferrii (strain ATCC 14091 / BCRC 22168 / CBS 111 / JCM 3599 / NBRC 0793 / NRRL Y-1031 F-60-10) TaxID=1206466 RepID=K0KAI3_WICCF|nr:Inorganic phosphate transporter [Wickerhamomyces ciferrii]CCH41990.1 Inorganic phosphate transporter [Wickerhamomyces ciferrii]
MSAEKNPAEANVKTAGGNAAFHNYLNDFSHIDDPLERRRLALEKIDQASFGWYHIRAITVAGVGFLTDAYDIFAINLGLAMIAYVYWGGSIPSSTSTLLKVSTSVGTVIGQLGFGFLADVVGRKKIYGLELIIMIAATIAQCVIGTSPAINFTAIMTFFRIIQGIGIGGDYPMSSVISSEFATTKWRGAIMGAVFANQGWGQLCAGLVALICVAAYKDELIVANTAKECTGDCIKACDQMWRILIGLGCVPGVIALYYRLTIPESPRYTLDVEYDLEKAAADSGKFSSGQHGNADQEAVEQLRVTERVTAEVVQPPKASFKDFTTHFGQWRHFKILLGTAGSWFMLDVAYYGLGLNTATILQTIGYASSKNVYHSLYNSAAGNLILICAGSIPGYWFSVATIDFIGRKPIQIGGFFLLTVILCIIGFGYNKVGEHGLLGLYVIAQFFQNFGPNTTTFIVPGECYPTRYRSTAHGISAACGKVGAIIAQTALGTLIDHNCARDGKKKNCWLPHVMEIFALFMLVGLFLSFLIPETKRKTLEEIAEEVHGEVDPSKLNRAEKYESSDDHIV